MEIPTAAELRDNSRSLIDEQQKQIASLQKRIAELELRIDHGPRREGNIEMQAAAWAEVYRTCVECGLLSFDPRETGRARVVGFIRHLAGKITV